MPSEKERLLTAAASQRNIYIAPIIEFAIETGMRRSEILKLRWCIEVVKQAPQIDGRVSPISATCLRLA